MMQPPDVAPGREPPDNSACSATDDRLSSVHIGRSVHIVHRILEEWIRKHGHEWGFAMVKREGSMEPDQPIALLPSANN
jgi:hypothetical protein